MNKHHSTVCGVYTLWSRPVSGSNRWRHRLTGWGNDKTTEVTERWLLDYITQPSEHIFRNHEIWSECSRYRCFIGMLGNGGNSLKKKFFKKKTPSTSSMGKSRSWTYRCVIYVQTNTKICILVKWWFYYSRIKKGRKPVEKMYPKDHGFFFFQVCDLETFNVFIMKRERDTRLCGGLGHLKIETRLRGERFENVMGESPWVCDRETIGSPSMFRLIRKGTVLTRMWPTLDLICEETPHDGSERLIV